MLTSAQSRYFPILWRDSDEIWGAVMWYMVCGRAVCVYGWWSGGKSVCVHTSISAFTCTFEYVQTWSGNWNKVCVWDSFQWPNTTPIEMSPKVLSWFVARPLLPEACMDEKYPRHTHTCTHKSVESPLVCLENPGVLGDWIPSENTHYFSHSVGSVLRLLGINLLRKMKMRRPWAADSWTFHCEHPLEAHPCLFSHLKQQGGGEEAVKKSPQACLPCLPFISKLVSFCGSERHSK